MVPRTYPESFRAIAQKLSEKIDYEGRFSGHAIKNRASNTITSVLNRYVPGIPTGRNPHWTESPLHGIPTKFHAVGIPYLGARNPHWTESPQLGSHRVYMYCNLALQRHCEL